jgi:C_GCAxxG_C_C family probable redox protein
VLAGFGKTFGMDRDTAFIVARAFGGGMGQGRTCGAVSGALMVLGFKYRDETDESAARQKTYGLASEFVRRFEQRHGTTSCRELLGGVDLGREGGRQEAIDKGLFTTICPKVVLSAAEIIKEMM